MTLAVASTAGLALAAAFFARRSEEAAIQGEFSRLAEDREAAIREQMASAVQLLTAVDAFYAASEGIRAEEFATFTAPLLEEHPEVLLLGWARGKETAGLSMPLQYVVAAPELGELEGMDLASVPEWSMAMAHSRISLKAKAARAAPAAACFTPSRRWLFLAVGSTHQDRAASNPDTTPEYLVALIDLGRCVEEALEEYNALPSGIDIYLMEQGPDGSQVVLHGQPAASRKRDGSPLPAPAQLALGPHHRESFFLAGERVSLLSAPAPGFQDPFRSWTPWAILFVGMVCSIALAWSFWTITRNSRSLEHSNLDLREEIRRRQAVEVEMVAAKEQAEAANRAKGQFLANMSHELRTPLNGILGMARLLSDTRLTPEQHEQVETVTSSSDHLLAIVTQVLDFARLEAGEMPLRESEVDICRAVEDALHVVAIEAHGKGLEIVHEMDPQIPARVLCDAFRLQQVLLNLLGNAIKFTTHGEIVLRVLKEPDVEDRLTLRFLIEDTGPGIAPEILSRMYSPFMQADASMARKHGGMGLGLACSKQLVKLMGGDLGVENNPSRGCIAWFTLRLKRIDATETVRAPLAMRGRVLIVEDNQTVREVLGRRLAAWNLSIQVAGTASEAWEVLGAADSKGELPELVLLDFTLPDCDATDLASRIRTVQRWNKCHIVFMYPIGIAADVGAAKRLVDGSISKPWRDAQLEMSIANCLSADAVFPSPILPARDLGRNPPSLQNVRVLLAEDNTINQKVTMRILEKAGCTADLARDGREAVAAMSKAAYDIVLMDCQMPQMDGYEATAMIRQGEAGRTHIPIIALTAHALPEDRARCLAVGMDDYLTKPVRPEELVAAIKRLLKGSGIPA